MAAEREREIQRARNDGKPHQTEVLRAEARNALHLIGLGGDGVTHEDEMNARRGRRRGAHVTPTFFFLLLFQSRTLTASMALTTRCLTIINTTWRIYLSGTRAL